MWIIPAYAGCTHYRPFHNSSIKDHPRLRGVHQVSPPVAHRRSRIIPAYAGCTRIVRRHFECRQDHPRLRGVHATDDAECPVGPGSSPLTRGALIYATGSRLACGIIPAYAGCTGIAFHAIRQGGDHPRLRGVHRITAVDINFWCGSSPLTRGARENHFNLLFVVGIIPAYAGCTPACALGFRRLRDHPRLRGVHSMRMSLDFQGKGSSPLTRGALGRSM